jgi:hypothetical protein
MLKRTLIAAITLVVYLTSTTSADYETEYYGPFYPTDIKIIKDIGEKIDGKKEVLWPYRYEELTLCNIPIKMRVGMFVQVKDCRKKKIVLEQVSCADIGRGDVDYPCYIGCVGFDARANFRMKLGSSLHKDGDVIGDWSAYYDGGDIVPGDGDWHGFKLCVKAWKTKIYKAAPGDEVSVGSIDITVKPDV